MSEQNNNNLKDFLDTLSYPKGGNGGNGGGVSSWNDLTDKPFGEETTTGLAVFNGDMNSREHYTPSGNFVYIKMLDRPLEINKILGCTITHSINDRSEMVDLIVTSELVESMSLDEIGIGNGTVTMVSSEEGEGLLAVVDGEFMGVPTGTYFLGHDGSIDDGVTLLTMYTKSISCLTEEVQTIKKIDEKYLPDYSGALEEQLNKIYELNAAIDAKTGNE